MRIFLTMVAKTKSIHFDVNVPNTETQQVFEETDVGINSLDTSDGIVKYR
jgi:antitoxin component of RelBE/YafQ-DinJ toxin-antitoxin module